MATTNDHTPGEPLAARARETLNRYNPLYLAPLGFLSIPADYVDQLEILEIFGIFYLFFPWIILGPLVDLALRSRLEEESEPTDWIEAGSWKTLVVALATMPLVFFNPLALLQDIAQFVGGWLGGLVRHRGSLPDAESYEQSVEYRLPVEGEWAVVNGSPEQEYSHSWGYPTQRYAYDFLITDESGQTKPEDADPVVSEYYCYDEPVVAPADGVVVDAFDSALESTRADGFSHPAGRDIRGGYVVVRHAAEEYSMLAHLKPGSVPVTVGEEVQRGQEIGRCGHSGNSTEPHLHFQIQDHPTFELATSLPVEFDTVEIAYPGTSHDEDLIPGRDLSEGVHEQSYIVEGQRVSHAGSAFDQNDRADDTTPVDVEGQPEARLPRGASGIRTLKDTVFGVGVAGILLFLARIVLSGWPLVGVLAGGTVLGGLFAVGYRLRTEGTFETRSPGVPLGVGVGAVLLAASMSAGVSSGAVVGLLFLGGLVSYFVVAAVERRRFVSLSSTRPAV